MLQIQACWEAVKRQAGYEQRVKEAAVFNKANRWLKRGLSIIPVKFGGCCVLSCRIMPDGKTAVSTV